MGTLVQFTAENGSDGTAVSQANMPATGAPTVTGGSTYIFDDIAAAHGNLGYHLTVASVSQCLIRIDVTDHLTQRFRGLFKLISNPPGGKRPIIHFRRSGGVATRLLVDTSRQLCIQDTVNGAEAVGPALTAGTWYDLSLTFTVATSTTGTYTLKVYNKDTNTQVGSTLTSSAYNLGTANVIEVDLGTNDTVAGAIEYYWDSLRFEDNVTLEFPPLNIQPIILRSHATRRAALI